MQGYSIDRYSSNPKFDAPGHLAVHRGIVVMYNNEIYRVETIYSDTSTYEGKCGYPNSFILFNRAPQTATWSAAAKNACTPTKPPSVPSEMPMMSANPLEPAVGPIWPS